MRTIYRYRLGTTASQTVQLYRGYSIKHIGYKRGNLYMWVEVYTDEPLIDVKFSVFGTGLKIDTHYRGSHLQTVICPSENFVWHIYID